ncbi:hypothetical protein [Streptomyces sp. AC555_RSS877]|uniref:hypothetical protein n=1 Tax=Streptomyces sp. AC555_RSS877 TaxID=2823688 RepID=UPI001C25A73C|nr:hypothetical protein [Streptomyces sp. AC555_RSS877]
MAQDVRLALTVEDDLRSLLTQLADGHLDAKPVSLAVNNVRNHGPQLLDEIAV